MSLSGQYLLCLFCFFGRKGGYGGWGQDKENQENFKEADRNADPADDGRVCILYQGENIQLTGSRYEEHNYLYPIPQTEIDLNPALVQNPGYPTR